MIAQRVVAHRLTGPQQPIFRRAHGFAGKSLIQPLSIFAARRRTFDVIVRKLALELEAITLIFDALPLEESGWDMAATIIIRAGTSADNWPIWRISRG